MGTKRKKMPEGLEKHTSALIRSSWTSVHDSRWRFPSLHAIILAFLYITSQWLISSVASLLHASSPGAPSVHLLISLCAGKPPVQERQEDQEMASGMKIRKRKKKTDTDLYTAVIRVLFGFAFLSVVFCRCSLTLQSIVQSIVLDGGGRYVKAFPNSSYLR